MGPVGAFWAKPPFDKPPFCESVGPVQGSKSPKSGKEGFGVKKLPFPITSEKGALSQKIPISLVEPCREMGIFSLKAPISGALGNGSFLTPKPSFPDFGDFDPCTGPTLSQPPFGFPRDFLSVCAPMCCQKNLGEACLLTVGARFAYSQVSSLTVPQGPY